MKTLYLDLFSGISGDMFVGALIGLGADPNRLNHELQRLPLEGFHLHVSPGQKSGIAGIKFDVHVADHHHHEHAGSAPHSHEHEHEHGRNYSQIRELIAQSQLNDWVKEKSLAVFERIAVAEAKIHGLPVDKVHFHEVGAVDSIVDIVGGCLALDLLGRPRVLASGVVDGTGWVDCAHGRLPIPVPATLAILGARGVAISQCDEPHELVTPTGAALVAELAESFGPMEGMVAEKIGYGLGSRNNRSRPNVLRAILGKSGSAAGVAGSGAAHDWEVDSIAVLETNLDDINAEILGAFMDKAFASGALDVFHTPIQMKKNRPGVLLTVLCALADADLFSEMLLRETSAFGLRRSTAERRKLQREFITVDTRFGAVPVKLGKLDGKVLHTAPEYESCRQLAQQSGVPLQQVYDAALRALPASHPV